MIAQAIRKISEEQNLSQQETFESVGEIMQRPGQRCPDCRLS